MDELMTTQGLAKRLLVTPETVRRWVKIGKIKPALKTPGGQMRFDPAEVRAMLEGETMTPRARLIELHVEAAQEKIRRMRRRA